MQNILFFIFRLYGGGAERVVSNLSMEFSEHYHVKVAIYDNLDKTYPYKGELIRIHLPFSENPTKNRWWQRLLRLIVLTYKVRKIKRQHNIDVAISFAEQANIVNILTKGKSRTILSVRTLLSKEIANTPRMKAFGHFIRRLYNKSDQIIVPSRLVALDLVNKYQIKEEKLKVIYNYIDQEKITTLATESIENDLYYELFQLPVLLNVGRITPAKGQWLLFEVLKKIRNQYPALKLVIVGESDTEGNLKEHLIQLSSDLSLKVFDSSQKQILTPDYDIYLLGFQMNPFKYMKHSKLLVFPSVFEGFPNTVLEAMQSGLPVIVADCQSGPREILAHDTDLEYRTTKIEMTEFGILAPGLPVADIHLPIDQEITNEWIAGITKLISDENLQVKFIRNGYQRVKDFDKESILRQWKISIDSK